MENIETDEKNGPEVVVVTGYGKNEEKMKGYCAGLRAKGYTELTDPSEGGAHPADVGNKVLSWKFRPGRWFVKTNSDHVVNALRVLRKRKAVKAFSAVHFGESGEPETATCGADGEFDYYPDGFLDEYVNLLSELLSTADASVA